MNAESRLTKQARILVFGAHPDDCEFKAGGSAALWAAAGHTVKFVSMTNGDTGHFDIGGGPLAWRRQAEARSAAELIGIESQVLDYHNGELTPDLHIRKHVIRIIREFNPDLILTHRPNDYHPDHRYTSQLVQDAAYIVTVPNMVALTSALKTNPTFAFLHDDFTRPYPFSPDVAIDITPVIETKVHMLHQHASQMYEWLPYNRGVLEQVPSEESERLEWLQTQVRERFRRDADRCRQQLIETYGERGRSIEYAESFEICELGSPLTDEKRDTLFGDLISPA